MAGNPTRTLVLVVLVIVVGFIGATYESERREQALDEVAKSIAGEEAAVTDALWARRWRARRIERACERALAQSRAGQPPSLTALDEAIAEARAPAAGTDGGGAFALVDRRVAALADEAAALRGLLAAGAVAAADRRLLDGVQPSADSVETALGDVRQARVLVARRRAAWIDGEQRKALQFAYGADAILTALALVAIVLVVRSARGFARLAAERDRRAAELDLFASRVAHDVLGPLTATRLSLEHMLARVDGADQALVRRGLASLDRSRGIVDALLAFARAGGAPEPGASTDLAAVAREVADELRPLAEEARVTVTVEAAEPTPAACASGVAASIVVNLLRNAVKFTSDSAVRAVTVRVAPRGDLARLDVEDTGPGVPPALGASVFEPYVRGAAKGQPGVGLGLSIVKRAAEAHGGRVGYLARPGGGAWFWVELPRPRGDRR